MSGESLRFVKKKMDAMKAATLDAERCKAKKVEEGMGCVAKKFKINGAPQKAFSTVEQSVQSVCL